MKSIQIEKFGGPEVLVYKDEEIRKPGPKEVLIKNLNHDLKTSEWHLHIFIHLM